MSRAESPKRIVVKVGGSLLPDESAYRPIAARLAGFLRHDPRLERLYVVISAMKSVTDGTIDRIAPDRDANARLRELLEGATPSGQGDGRWDRPPVALALLWGEIESSYLLAEALDGEGLPSRVVTQLGFFPIVARGGSLRAELDLAASRRRFAAFNRGLGRRRIVILPGFAAADGRGRPALLGRNASDFSAAVLSALDRDIGLVVFLKDVGGVYAGFGTAGERLIVDADVAQLRAAGPQKVLDPRVLDIIACDFRVTGAAADEGSGTTVRLGRTA